MSTLSPNNFQNWLQQEKVASKVNRRTPNQLKPCKTYCYQSLSTSPQIQSPLTLAPTNFIQPSSTPKSYLTLTMTKLESFRFSPVELTATSFKCISMTTTKSSQSPSKTTNISPSETPGTTVMTNYRTTYRRPPSKSLITSVSTTSKHQFASTTLHFNVYSAQKLPQRCRTRHPNLE